MRSKLEIIRLRVHRDEIGSLYPLRWSHDLVNKMYTALLSFLKGLKSVSNTKREGHSGAFVLRIMTFSIEASLRLKTI